MGALCLWIIDICPMSYNLPLITYLWIFTLDVLLIAFLTMMMPRLACENKQRFKWRPSCPAMESPWGSGVLLTRATSEHPRSRVSTHRMHISQEHSRTHTRDKHTHKHIHARKQFHRCKNIEQPASVQSKIAYRETSPKNGLIFFQNKLKYLQWSNKFNCIAIVFSC